MPMKPVRSSSTWRLVLAVLCVVCATAAGCSKRDHFPSIPEPPVAAAPQAVMGGQGQAAPAAPVERAMRITIETSVTVADIDAAARAVRDLTAQHGGYVGEARTSGDDDARSAWFEVHVPVPQLGAFRGGVAGLGEVTSDSEKAEDVTEQRADIRARLANSRAEEKRLLELLDKHTGTLADVVALEKELANVRETIERMEAQERVLEGQIASATVRIHLMTRHAATRIGPGKRIFHAMGDGLDNAGAFLVGLAVFIAQTGPTLLILFGFGYAIFRVVRFGLRQKKPKAS
jgi:hypothetical protein